MKNHLTRKVGFEGTPKLVPYWKSQPATYKVNMEWKLELNLKTKTSLTCGSEFLMAWISWSRTWSTKSTTTTSRNPPRYSSKILRWKRMHLLFRADHREKQNHQDVLLLAHPQELYPSVKESDITQCQNQLRNLFRHGRLPREDDGAIELWRIKEYLRNDLERSQDWSDEKWKSTMTKCGGKQKRFQYCTDPSGQEILYLRALQGHSGRKFIDPSLQDNVLIPNDFFEYILSHRMCNQFTLHRESRIDTRMTKFEQKTDGILHVCGSNEQGT